MDTAVIRPSLLSRRPRTLVFTWMSIVLAGMLLVSSVWGAPVAQAPISISSFTLINAETDQPIAGFDPLIDGTVLNLASLPTRQLSIRANPSAGTIGSVEFTLDGSPYSVENAAPYLLAGNNGSDYLPWIPSVGVHTLTATPYSGGNAAGTAGSSLTITFTVNDPTTSSISVQTFTLIDANTDQAIAGFDPLPNNAILDLATLPTRNLNIRANTSPASVGSVAFTYDRHTFNIEGTPPYALAGDTGGNYAAWTPTLGGHTLTALPYSGNNAGGNVGTGLTQQFTVIDSSITPTATATDTSATQTALAATQTAAAQTQIAQTQIAQTATAIAATPTATTTALPATQTAVAALQTAMAQTTVAQTAIAQTAIAQTATAMAATATATSTATATLTTPTTSATIAVPTPTTQSTNPNPRLFLPLIVR